MIQLHDEHSRYGHNKVSTTAFNDILIYFDIHFVANFTINVIFDMILIVV